MLTRSALAPLHCLQTDMYFGECAGANHSLPIQPAVWRTCRAQSKLVLGTRVLQFASQLALPDGEPRGSELGHRLPYPTHGILQQVSSGCRSVRFVNLQIVLPSAIAIAALCGGDSLIHSGGDFHEEPRIGVLVRIWHHLIGRARATHPRHSSQHRSLGDCHGGLRSKYQHFTARSEPSPCMA